MDLIKLIQDTFNLESDTQILDTHSPGQLEGWDSLGHANLMVALESTYGISIGLDEMILIETVADIKQLLKDKGLP